MLVGHQIISDIKKGDGATLTNYPFYSIVNFLEVFEDMNIGRPFIDETGIDKNIPVDFKLNGDMSNIENIQSQLREYGLDIIKAEREIEVLVISDKK